MNKTLIRAFFVVLIFVATSTVAAAAPWSSGDLRVSSNGHYLQNGNTPFLWFGDTAWWMPHRLSVSEANIYYSDRKNRGFNVVQMVVTGTGSIDGVLDPMNSVATGELPFHGKNGGDPRYQNFPTSGSDNIPDPTKPNEAFFSHLDGLIGAAQNKGLYIALFTSWGRYTCPTATDLKNHTPIIFNSSNAYTYGKFLGNRYKNYKNIIWVMGGDHGLCSLGKTVQEQMVRGIKDAGDRHLITFHPGRDGSVSSDFWRSSGYWYYRDNGYKYPSWLDFNMSQTDAAKASIMESNKKDYAISPVKPTILGEPQYASVHSSFANHAPDEVRSQPYYQILSGGAGYTHGQYHMYWFDKDDGKFPTRDTHQNVKDGVKWTSYLGTNETKWAAVYNDYFSSIDWWNIVPDQSLILSGANTSDAYQYKVAARSNTHDRIWVYFADSTSAKINLAPMLSSSGTIYVQWLNPKDGTQVSESSLTASLLSKTFSIPSGWEDGLLILSATPETEDPTTDNTTVPHVCDYLTQTTAVPNNFAAAYNLYAPSRMLLTAFCNADSSVTMTVGDNDQYTYVYNKGYYYHSGVSGWQVFTYSCPGLVADTWCPKQGTATIPNLPPERPTYIISYACQWVPAISEWYCGCHDHACVNTYWNLQAF